MGDKGAADEVDYRLEFVSDHVLRSLKLKPDKWQKLMSGEDRHIIYRFFDTPKYDIVIFRVNTSGLLTASLTFPTLSRGKLIYFLKMFEDKVTGANFRQILAPGEMSSTLLLELGVLMDEVFGPMLCNPANQRGWPTVIVNDMAKHVNELRNTLYELRGEMTSQVLLPMPTGVEAIYQAETRFREGDGVDLQLKTNIEGAVIKWTQQINDVLKEDSLIAFKRTKFPLPLADVTFYTQRLQNVEGIYSQLRDPRVRKMAMYLESAASVYLDCFRTMLTNIVAAIVECRDIVIHQKPLIIHFESLEGCDFTDCKPLIRPTFHCIGLLWGNSRYYCSAEKLIPLLREVCNLMIQQCSNSCDPSTAFQGEPDEQIIKIRNVISILKHFIAMYEMARDKVHMFFPTSVPPTRWSFDFDRVFMRYNIYLKRLTMIEHILHNTNEILKLEKVEYSGLRGKILSSETQKIREDYLLQYQNLGNITYDPADPEDNSFLPDYEQFLSHILDADRKLAAVFTQGLDECNNLEQFFKFFQIIGDLFHRPVIKEALQPKLPKLLRFMQQNLDTVKGIFDQEMAVFNKTPHRPMIEPFHPPVAGMLWWINKLRKRITKPLEEFVTLEDPITESEEALYTKQKHAEMMGYLNQIEDRLFKQWAATVPNVCKLHLTKYLVYRQDNLIKVNFAPELDLLLREIRYLRYLDKQGIPPDGVQLYARNEKLQQDLNRLRRAVSWYNDIREGSHETEVALIEREIASIDEMWSRGVDEFNWNHDFTEWMDAVYAAIDALQQRVLTAQANVQRGLTNMAAWGDVPLYNRKDNQDKLQLLALKECESRYIAREKKILESHEEFQDIMEENYKLFFNIQEEVESEDEEEDEEEMDEAELDEEQLAALQAKRDEREQRRIEREERRRIREEEKAAHDEVIRIRREARRAREEAKELVRQERAARRAEAEEAGEEYEEEESEEEDLSDDELADMELEQQENELKEYRETRWKGYVGHVDSLDLSQLTKRQALFSIYISADDDHHLKDADLWAKDKKIVEKVIPGNVSYEFDILLYKVGEAVVKAIETSVNLFETQTDLENGPKVAFMEVVAELRDPDVHFTPSLSLDSDGGLYDMVRTMMKDMFMQATMFPRLDQLHDYPNYEDMIPEHPHVIELYHEILARVKRSIADLIIYVQRYEKYQHLWLDDRQEVLANFLRYGRVLTMEEAERLQFDQSELEERKPALSDYQTEIDKYLAMYDEMAAMPPNYLVNGWLRLDLKRLNQGLINLICKWSHMFKKNLVDHVHTSLDDLEEFIIYATKELSVPLADDDYDGLLRVMGVLNEVKAKMEAKTDEMFDPLREIMYVLKEYGVEFDEETYEQLDVLPEKWRGLVKLATVVKNNVGPLQAAQAALIAKRVSLLALRLQMYRDTFSTKSFFLESCLEPYKQIDLANLDLKKFEDTVETLNKSCQLFDIQPADTKCLKQCRKELRQIKQLWDYYYLVVGTFDSWKTTPWKKIDADGMDQQCKIFTKDIRQLDKEMRNWEPYLVIEAMIKNLMTSLRAVTELQNPAIKFRHWIELMKATKDARSNSRNIVIPAVDHQLNTSPPSLVKHHHHNRISFEEIVEDFKSLDVEFTIDGTIAKSNGNANGKAVEPLLIHDYRRPKYKEIEARVFGKLRKKFNHSYSKITIAEDGTMVNNRTGRDYQKRADFPYIFSEFIL